MGSAQSYCQKGQAGETSSSDVGSNDKDIWVPISDGSSSNNNNDSDDDYSGEEDDDEEEIFGEQLHILEETCKLRMMVEFFLHPEKPVKVSTTVCGRCYFELSSAPQQTSQEESVEATGIIEEAMSLKKLAVGYMHPERPVKTTATACARCYFDRASAPQQSPIEEEKEKSQILADLRLLKKAARDYLHPEEPVEVADAAVFERNYFTLPSAPEQSNPEEELERELILEGAKALRKLATQFQHPELPVETNPTLFGRNYFNRPSAPMQNDEKEWQLILKDAPTLCKLAADYQHPELPVETNPTVFGRNYFNRPSAPEHDDEKERQLILKDAKALRKLAVDYQHPELSVNTDPTAFGRNYFSRPSAPDQEDEKERQLILKDAKSLHKMATDYQRPELPVETDPTIFGRNYEAAPTVFGRNYYNRPSAPEQAHEEERELVLKDAKALCKLATDFQHPELPVETDPMAFGRNYFNRPSAPQQEEEEERQLVLKDTKALCKLATDFQHPALLVETDPAVFGRNYFNRPSAPRTTPMEEEKMHQEVEEDLKQLKKLAADYHHPELLIETDPTAFARSYFGQSSAANSGGIKSPSFDENEYYYHHAHFDMDDDIHRQHVEFDRNMHYHEEITEVRVMTPTTPKAVINDFDLKLSMSPGCVLTFTQPKTFALPQLD